MLLVDNPHTARRPHNPKTFDFRKPIVALGLYGILPRPTMLFTQLSYHLLRYKGLPSDAIPLANKHIEMVTVCC